MNVADLNSLTQYVDGSGQSMWPIEAGTLETAAIRYVRLSDVIALLEKEEINAEK